MQRYGHQIAGMDVPGAGDDLYRFGLPRVDLADPHMVAVRVALHGQDAAHHYVGNFCAQIRGGFHLGTGEGHGFVKFFIIGRNGDKLVEPFSAQ